jgi:hypothetical protein
LNSPVGNDYYIPLQLYKADTIQEELLIFKQGLATILLVYRARVAGKVFILILLRVAATAKQGEKSWFDLPAAGSPRLCLGKMGPGFTLGFNTFLISRFLQK